MKKLIKLSVLSVVALLCALVFVSCKKGDAGKQGVQGIQGEKGLNAYELFLLEYPGYTDSQTQWVIDLANGQLLRTVTFKADGNDDIVFIVLYGSVFTDIPEIPFKENYTGIWDIGALSLVNITANIVISANYIKIGGDEEPPIEPPLKPGDPGYPELPDFPLFPQF